MYEIPGTSDITSITITGPVVRGETTPLLQRKQTRAAA